MNTTNYALKVLNVFNYRNKAGIEGLKNEVSRIYDKENVYITLNGRSAIYLFLKSLNLEKGSKVAVQAFTCNAVINPILSLGLEPLYVDINESNFNMDYEDFSKKVNEVVKVVVIQHTFGIKADSRIIRLCREKGIYVLEDCASAIGDTALGNEGDAAILSFGIEKMLPTRVGGVLLLNNVGLKSEIEVHYSGIKQIGYIESFLWLINPFLWRVLRLIPQKFSNAVKNFLKSLGILKSGFSRDDLNGNLNFSSQRGLSGVLAEVGLECLTDLQNVISQRRLVSNVYRSNLEQKFDVLVRYPYVARDEEVATKIISFLESKGFPSENRWYNPVIFPNGTNISAMKYIPGICPVAEEISKRIVNLPTGNNVNEKMALEISRYIMNLK